MSTMGERIKTSREAKGLFQSQLAEMVGVRSAGVISNWEKDINKPDADKIVRLCQSLDISASFLLDYNGEKNAPSISDEALKIAQDYQGLDRHGKAMVLMVVTEERKRMEEEDLRRKAKSLNVVVDEETGEPVETRVIPLYFTPAAAGYASPAFGEDFDYIDIGGDVPRQADFAVKIDGDSMEPYIMDGSTVYVNRDPLENGDVGIFFLDGDMLCKQYYKDDKGEVRLLSLNRNRSDADRFVYSDSTMTCYGRVILPHRPKISML